MGMINCIDIKIGAAKIERTGNNSLHIEIQNNDGQVYHFYSSGNGFVTGKYDNKVIKYSSTDTHV